MLLPTVPTTRRRPPSWLIVWVLAGLLVAGASGCFPVHNASRSAENSILDRWAILDQQQQRQAGASAPLPGARSNASPTGALRAPKGNDAGDDVTIQLSTGGQVVKEMSDTAERSRMKGVGRPPQVEATAHRATAPTGRKPASPPPSHAAAPAPHRRPPPISYPAELDRRVVGVNFQDDPPLPSPPKPKVAAKKSPPAPTPSAVQLDAEPEEPNPDSPPLRAPVRPALPPAAAPEPDESIHIPLEGDEPSDAINLTMKNGKITLIARNAPVQSILNLMAQQQGLNLIVADDVIGNISVNLTDAGFDDVLSSIVAIAGCTWTQQKGIVLVTKISADAHGGPGLQGKVVQVFPLNFVSATDIEATIHGLISPTGQIFVTEISPTDKRRTQEQVVVEDIPSSLQRIAEYISQVDQPPRQVMIEAHVLQVDLKDDTRHGINWSYLTRLANKELTLSTQGFANPAALPASILSLDGSHLDVLVEALKTTTDTKTLANPKVIVANGQEARIQIGSKLGYFVTTTTQTSTLQNVNFLNTGVLLKVTPQISNDNRLLLHVQPEISSGKISAAGLPETETTEASTTVLMEDGGGMVIGGLIKESDNEVQDKIPILGDMWLVGRLFQRRSVNRQRSEIIIVLIPRIEPYSPDSKEAEQADVAKACTPIFEGALHNTDRPWEPKLPDAIENPRRLRLYRLPALLDDPTQNNPKPLRYYFPTQEEEWREQNRPPPVEEMPLVSPF